MRGVLDPVLSIGRLVEDGRPAVAVEAERRERASAEARANGNEPHLAADLARFVVWGAALAVLLKVASRFRRRPRRAPG
jgi:hypothetical protein